MREAFGLTELINTDPGNSQRAERLQLYWKPEAVSMGTIDGEEKTCIAR